MEGYTFFQIFFNFFLKFYENIYAYSMKKIHCSMTKVIQKHSKIKENPIFVSNARGVWL